MPILLGNYTFSCEFESHATLPPFKGSTFRGLFGRTLKKTVCALNRQTCDDCLLKAQCLYPLTFETEKVLKPKEGHHHTAIPHPYAIHPPLSTQTHYEKGSVFDINLLLFGALNDKLPYFVFTLEQMGKEGAGKNPNISGKFRVRDVTQEGCQIYNGQEGILRPNPPRNLDLLPTNTPQDKTQTLKITLKTPLRLKFENRLHADLPFHVLVRAMLRRVSSLMDYFGTGSPPELDYSRMIKEAAEITPLSSELTWLDVRRYSSRQKEAMMMGGITGQVTYRGKIGAYLPLISFCEKVGIGKQTTFGLGQFDMTLIDERS